MSAGHVVALVLGFALSVVLYPAAVQAADNLVTIIGPGQDTKAEGASVIDHKLLVTLDAPVAVRGQVIVDTADHDPLAVEGGVAIRGRVKVETPPDEPLDVSAAVRGRVNVDTPPDDPLDVSAAVRGRVQVDAPNSDPLPVQGDVQVGDGKGALTVDGHVQAHPALPNTPWWYRIRVHGPGGSNEREALFNAPTPTTKLALSSLTISMSGARQQSIDFFLYDGTDCFGERDPVVAPFVEDHGTLQLTFPSPMVLGPYGDGAWSLCAAAYIPDSSAYVEVVGEGFYL